MPMKIMILAATAMALGLSQAANAIEEVGQAYITPMATYINGGADRDKNSELGGDIKEGIEGGQLGIGFALEEHWNMELVFQRLQLRKDSDSSIDIDENSLSLNVLNLYNRDGWLSPYLLAGVGVLNNDVDGGGKDQDNLQALAGAGFMIDLWGDRVALRAEWLGRWVDAHDSFWDQTVNFGFQVALGSKKKAPPPPPPAPADTDADGDGVVDRLDKCPNTPKGAVVDASGCPKDADGDGVFDGIDKCPNTPKGAIVDASGCPKDSDGDGVFDGIDKCPNTPKGVRVDAVGCEVAIDLPRVFFELNSDRLRPESSVTLDNAARILKENPRLEVEVAGHTDSSGTDAYNLGLSQRRANAVRQYLINAGIASTRMTAKGYGESEPIADNETEAGRQQNRRVGLSITKR